MNHFCLSIFVGVGLVFVAQPASAQSPSSKAKAPLNNSANKDKSEAKAEADRVAKERRAQARSLLISLASDARSFHDQTLRARSLARIADTLWSVDAELGILFSARPGKPRRLAIEKFRSALSTASGLLTSAAKS